MTDLHFACRIETGIPDYATAARLAQLAEARTYDSVWVRDHVAIPETTNDDNCLECFTVLAGLARDTQRVKLGSLVMCNPWRNPALVAKMGATIDNMAGGGRFMLGIGAGASGQAREFERYGWEVPAPADRARAVGEAMQVCRLMWTEDHPSFQGRYYSLDDAICRPRPVERPLMMVGGSGPIMLKQTVLHADGWNTAGTLEAYVDKVARIDALCEEHGRDPQSLFRSTNQIVIIDRTQEAAERRRRRMLEDKPGMARLLERSICGGPEQVAAEIRPFQDLGATMFITYFWESDPQAQLENIDAFGSEVIPLLRP